MLRRSLIVAAALAAVVTVSASAAPKASLPSRIISLSPSMTEDLFAVGAGPQVIAVDQDSDYPKNAPRSKLSGLTPNIEAIASYNPDLVVISYDNGLVAQLQKLDIKTLLEPAPNNVAEAYQEIRDIGQATGHTAAATKVVRGMEKTLTSLIRSVPKKSRHLKVFHELSPDFYSATSSTFIGRIYKLFGFRNIADAADSSHTGYPQLSPEYIISANPDIVVLADDVCCGQSTKTVSSRAGWSNVAAVKKHRVVAVDDSVASRWGPRIIDFARAIAKVARQSS